MKVALVYDRINKWGGAERVLLTLHEMFPDAPLYTSVYNSKGAKWAEVFDIKTSFLQKFPKASVNHEKLAFLMPLVFENHSFDKFDLVISVTSEAAKGIITGPKTKHICYCLTPTRYLWSGYEEYFKNKLLRFLSKPAVSYLRKWDKLASKRPDYFVAISKEVQNRIKKYYERESIVIYPPLTLSAEIAYFKGSCLGFPSTPATPSLPVQNYFLVVSRLVPYKRIDLVVKAFNKLKLSLKIIGTGTELKKLKKMAGKNIEFLGSLTDKELIRYYKESSAIIFPSLEDFGLTIIESQFFGKPVIAFRGGAALETILDGKTGELFYPQHEEALIQIIKNFRPDKYKVSDCQKQAGKFSKERFRKEFIDFIGKIM